MCGNENLWPFQKDEKNIIIDLFYMYNNWTEDLVYVFMSLKLHLLLLQLYRAQNKWSTLCTLTP
jgi:hypothetical protein